MRGRAREGAPKPCLFLGCSGPALQLWHPSHEERRSWVVSAWQCAVCAQALRRWALQSLDWGHCSALPGQRPLPSLVLLVTPPCLTPETPRQMKALPLHPLPHWMPQTPEQHHLHTMQSMQFLQIVLQSHLYSFQKGNAISLKRISRSMKKGLSWNRAFLRE